jgi:Helix-turn-helix domain
MAIPVRRPEGAPAGASDLGLLPKTLRRRFLRRVGLTPKRFARVQRLRRVVRSIQAETAVDWADLAAEHGYCDQAHLVDDFRDLAGSRRPVVCPLADKPRRHEAGVLLRCLVRAHGLGSCPRHDHEVLAKRDSDQRRAPGQNVRLTVTLLRRVKLSSAPSMENSRPRPLCL